MPFVACKMGNSKKYICSLTEQVCRSFLLKHDALYNCILACSYIKWWKHNIKITVFDKRKGKTYLSLLLRGHFLLCCNVNIVQFQNCISKTICFNEYSNGITMIISVLIKYIASLSPGKKIDFTQMSGVIQVITASTIYLSMPHWIASVVIVKSFGESYAIMA